MAIFNFFKQPKPRQYNHVPIYYDKQKEERAERYERIRKEMEKEQAEKEGRAPELRPERRDFEKDIRGSFRQAVPGGSRRDKIEKFSRIFFIVCAVLLLAVLLIYFTM